MKKLVTISIGVLFSLIIGEQSFSSQFRTLSYEDVREEGGFNAPSLRNVMELIPGGRNLGAEEIETLAQSTSLVSLRTLDLTNQQLVDDTIVRQLVGNPTFSRIITLRLNGTNVTNESIEAIANSENLGSVRDLPQISGRYDIPSSVVKVYTQGTRVTDTKQKTKFEFHIEYRPPNPKAYPWEPVDHGVKIIEIETW